MSSLRLWSAANHERLAGENLQDRSRAGRRRAKVTVETYKDRGHR